MDSGPVRLPVVSSSAPQTQPRSRVRVVATKLELLLWIVLNAIVWWGVFFLRSPFLLP